MARRSATSASRAAAGSRRSPWLPPSRERRGAICRGLYRGRMSSPFTPKTLSFLRALKRNNDRDWFRARKDQYEQHVRGPMVQLLARLSADFAKFAPELVAEPRVSL